MQRQAFNFKLLTKEMGEAIEFNCPYCGEVNNTEVFLSDGKSQSFVYDCEVCCRPIEVSIEIDKDGIVNLEIRNDEGF